MFAASKTASVSGGYQISRSLRFNSADSTYLNRTPASAGNRKTWTWSAWIKRNALAANQYVFNASPDSFNNTFSIISFGSGANEDKLRFIEFQGGSQVCSLRTTQVFRDSSAWYHLVLVADTTQATDTNRFKMYVNGVQITSFDLTSYPAQNTDLTMNNNVLTTLGYITTTNNFSGYMTEVNFIDCQSLTPSSFGETNAQTGVWQPKAYSGSYGTNGFYLNFSDNSNTTAATLGKDYSGNGNNWTPNNFSVSAGVGNDSLFDTPTPYGVDTGAGGEVRGNYCTFNPLFKLGGTTALTWALNGNLQAKSDSNASMVIYGTIGLDPSTKFYNEFTMTNTVEGADHVGIVTDIQAAADSGTCVAYRADGQKIVNGTVSSYGASYTDNDIIGIAVNLVDNQVTFYKNGTSQGTITGVTSGTYFHRVRFNNVAGQQTEVYGNWGQRAFAYTAPSGFKALCTQNLPTPTIGATTATQAGKFFNPVLWTGNGALTRSITGVGFQPDFVWIKNRSNSISHALYNVIVGGGANKGLASNTTDSEASFNDDATYGYLSSFDSDGLSVNRGTDGSASYTNANALSYVAWNWKANGTGSTNTSGSITSTVSANTTSGFSIVTYTGNGTSSSTVGHGLGAVPSMFIVKARSASGLSWYVYQKDVGNTKFLELNDTAAPTTFNLWESTNPTSSVFTISNNSAVNGNGTTFVAYCFAPVAGFSAFGSYTGNGSADGPFVYTGFRTAYFMVKRTDTSGFNWIVYDTTRDTYNVAGKELIPNASTAEATYPILDFLSNGFKLRINATSVNDSGGTYIYMCFASNPFKYSLAR
jgi:hypothetical protein